MSLPRILLVLPEFPPSIGGMQTHAEYLSHYLSSKGYRIEVATYKSTNSITSEELTSHDRHLNFLVHRVLSRLGFWHNLNLLNEIAHRFQPDLVYSSTVFYGLLQMSIDKPVVCRSVGNDLLRPWMGYPYRLGSAFMHNLWVERIVVTWFERASHPEWLETIFRNKRFALVRDSVKKMSRILANSKFTASLLVDLEVPVNRIETLSGGVDTKRFKKPSINVPDVRDKLGLPKKAFMLLTVCRMVGKKGVDLLLNAVRVLRATVPNVHLVVVGEGKYKKKYQDLTYSLGIENAVTFVGRVPHGIVHQYYWSCDVFVLASRTSINSFTGIKDVETMGRVLCEANAAGTPVVASRSGGTPSVITHEENGLLFTENNLDDLIKQIKRLRTDKGLAQRLIRNGLERAESEFDWSIILRHHEQVFTELIAGFS